MDTLLFYFLKNLYRSLTVAGISYFCSVSLEIFPWQTAKTGL